MGNTNSNSLDNQINKALETSPQNNSSSSPEPPILITNSNSRKFVNSRESSPAPQPELIMNTGTSSAAPNLMNSLSATSVGRSATSSAVPNPNNANSATSQNVSETSPGIPSGAARSYSSTSASNDMPPLAPAYRAPVPAPVPAPVQKGGQVVTLDPSVFLTSEQSMSGGNNSLQQQLDSILDSPILQNGGNSRVIKLDPAIFESSEMFGGGNDKSSEFNPEKFFKDMQSGGKKKSKKTSSSRKSTSSRKSRRSESSYAPSTLRSVSERKNKMESYLSSEEPEEDEETSFSFKESTDGLDVDENEDTEDLKQKVKQLRTMVKMSRSPANHESAKSTETPASGGASSVSEYLNSTSSISTSDVRLISMNKTKRG